MTVPDTQIRDVHHLPFDATRTYTGRYRNWYYRQIRDHITGRVLDLGSGSGEGTSDHYDGLTNAEYITLDIEFDENLDVQADGAHLPFKDNVFDTVLLSAVLEHLPMTVAPTVFEEIARVLRPGGSAIVGVPHQYPLHSEPFDFSRPTVFGLEDLFEHAGFTEIECYRGGSYSEVLLHVLFFPFRATLMYLGIRQLAWAFAPVHYLVCVLARCLSAALTATYGENPFGSRWYLQTFGVAQTPKQAD